MAMLLTGVARITRDPELRSLPGGEPVLQLALAYNYGIKRNEQGFLPTQFVDAGLFGERARRMSEHLAKGDVIQVTLSDVHIEEFTRRDNTVGNKLAARVDRIDFIPGQRQESERGEPRTSAPPAQQPRRERAAPAPAAARGSGFDDMDDDLPF